MKRLVLFSVLTLLLSGIAINSTALAGPPDVRVPNVVDTDVDTAVARLAAKGLEADVRWSAYAETGRVIAQDPHAGALVRAGGAVEIVAGLRIPVDTIVPSVVDHDVDEALRALAPVYEVELVDVPARRPSHDGRVVAQDPVAGARHPFRGVIQLSIGRAGLEPEITRLPGLVGATLAEAEQALLDRGLVPYPVFARGRPGEAWSVTGQDPAAGVDVPTGSPVRLQVVRPRGWGAAVRVPSLYGLDAEGAVQALTALGLQAEIVRRPSLFPVETVLRTAPARGDSATRGSSVRVVVAVPGQRHGHRRVPPVAVPDLRHRDLAEVRAVIREAGLRLAVRRVIAPERAPEQVIVQRPAAGSAVRLGAVVLVDLPKLAEVPLLLGRDRDTARKLAADAGFSIHLEGDALGRHGGTARVVDQHPAPGSIAAVGSTLRVVVRARRGGQGGRGVAVPDLKGLSATVARERLRDLGLEARFRGPRLPVSVMLEVVAQDPMPGARVARGTTVQATLGLRPHRVPAMVRVPDVVGLSLTDAERMLEAAGFAVRATFVRGGGRRGVTGQQPGVGTLHPRGGEVRLTVRR